MDEIKVGDIVHCKKASERMVVVEVDENEALVRSLWDHCFFDPKEKRLSLEDLECCFSVPLNDGEYRCFVRLECDIEGFFDDNWGGEVLNIENYPLKVEDLLAAFKTIRREQFDDDVCDMWISCIRTELLRQTAMSKGGVYNERDALFTMIDEVNCDQRNFFRTGIDSAIEEGEIFLEDRDKLPYERRYPNGFKRRLVRYFNGHTDVLSRFKKEDPSYVDMYRFFAEGLAEELDCDGLIAVGYGCYGGNEAFECDWERSRDCMLTLLDIDGRIDEQARYANTLGYIYYYGRCNGGVPDYEEAYKYFSFAAFNGVYEARYKVADMFNNGYYVPKSKGTAIRMVWDLYNENIGYIKKGDFDCKFADVALRLGGYCEELGFKNKRECCDMDEVNDLLDEPIDEMDDPYSDLFYGGVSGFDYVFEDALYYYTQAKYAIDRRMEGHNYYGDGKVKRSIESALDRVKSSTGFEVKESVTFSSMSGVLKDAIDGKKLEMVIKKSDGASYTVTFSTHKREGEKHPEKMFITVPDIGMCGLYSTVTAVYEPYSPTLNEDLLDRTFVIDDIRYFDYFFEGNVLFSEHGRFTLTNRKGNGCRKYRIARVWVEAVGRTLDYRCDEDTKQGDAVAVDVVGTLEEGKVISVEAVRESDILFPIKAYKWVHDVDELEM